MCYSSLAAATMETRYSYVKNSSAGLVQLTVGKSNTKVKSSQSVVVGKNELGTSSQKWRVLPLQPVRYRCVKGIIVCNIR